MFQLELLPRQTALVRERSFWEALRVMEGCSFVAGTNLEGGIGGTRVARSLGHESYKILGL